MPTTITELHLFFGFATISDIFFWGGGLPSWQPHCTDWWPRWGEHKVWEKCRAEFDGSMVQGL